MIYELEGDILLSKAQVITQGVSANDPMNQGLAKLLHENFPQMHKDFHQWCHLQHPKPGEIWLWNGLLDTKIVHLIIQEGGYAHHPQPKKTTLSHIKHALHALKKMAVKEKFTSIALPKLADGELEWADVLAVIHYELEDMKIPVYVYASHKPKQRALEPVK